MFFSVQNTRNVKAKDKTLLLLSLLFSRRFLLLKSETQSQMASKTMLVFFICRLSFGRVFIRVNGCYKDDHTPLITNQRKQLLLKLGRALSATVNLFKIYILKSYRNLYK